MLVQLIRNISVKKGPGDGYKGVKVCSHRMLRSVTVTITLTEAPLIFLKGTVMGRMGCIPILPINVLFVTVMVTESLCVNRPLYQYLEGDSDIFEETRKSSDLDLRW